MVPIFGWGGFFVAWVGPLTVASFVNILLAALVYKKNSIINGNFRCHLL